MQSSWIPHLPQIPLTKPLPSGLEFQDINFGRTHTHRLTPWMDLLSPIALKIISGSDGVANSCIPNTLEWRVDGEFKSSLSYIAKPYFKNKTTLPLQRSFVRLSPALTSVLYPKCKLNTQPLPDISAWLIGTSKVTLANWGHGSHTTLTPPKLLSPGAPSSVWYYSASFSQSKTLSHFWPLTPTIHIQFSAPFPIPPLKYRWSLFISYLDSHAGETLWVTHVKVHREQVMKPRPSRKNNG